MTNLELKEIFDQVHTSYFSKNHKIIKVDFYPYRSLRHTIEWNRKSINVKVSQYFQDAPIKIIKILAIILLAKVYKFKIDSNFRQIYKKYSEELQSNIPKPKRRNLQHYNPQGKYFNLAEIFDSINELYFSKKLNIGTIGWSQNKSYSRLGFYDKERDLLVISKIFDSKKVPLKVVEFLVFHEMLHIYIPSKSKNGRRRIHTQKFRQMEQSFPEFYSIDKWIKKKIIRL